MAVQKYEFAYGRGTQSFEYDDADVLKVVRTEPQPSKGTCSTCSSTPSGSRRSARL